MQARFRTIAERAGRAVGGLSAGGYGTIRLAFTHPEMFAAGAALSPAVYDPALGPEYGVSGYPTTYVLDGENRVVGAHSGEAPREVYEGWIEEAL